MQMEGPPAAHGFLLGRGPQEAALSRRGGSDVNTSPGRSAVHLGPALLGPRALSPPVPAAPPLPAFRSAHVSAPRRVSVFTVSAEAGGRAEALSPGVQESVRHFAGGQGDELAAG